MTDWNEAHGEIAALAKRYVTSGESDDAQALLSRLRELPADDRFAQSVVRYLGKKERWHYGSEPFTGVLDHLFAAREGRNRISPEQYCKETDALMKAWFDYEETPATVGEKPKAKTARKKKSS